MSIPDWLEYANAVGTVAAAGLAAWTIRQSAKNSDENQKALIRERRIDFELDILVDLAEANAREQVGPARDIPLATRAAMLPRDLLPITRAAVGLETSPQAEQFVEEKAERRPGGSIVTRSSFAKEEIRQEILDAIQQRLKERR